MDTKIGQETFQATHLPSRWWDSERLRALREQVLRSLSSGQVVLLLGQEGSGKTTELTRLILECGPEWVCCAGTATRQAVPSNLFHSLSDCLVTNGIFSRGSTSLDLARALAQSGRRPLLIIDDAHLASDAWLEALLELQASAVKEFSFALILAGIREFPSRLAGLNAGKPLADDIAPSDGQDIWEIVTIPPWEEADCQRYLETELTMAGCDIPGVFDDPQTVSALVDASAGNPRELRRLARARLESAHNDQTRRQHSRQRLRKIAMISGSLFFVSVSMLAAFTLMPRVVDLLGKNDAQVVANPLPTGGSVAAMATIEQGRVVDTVPPLLSPWLQQSSIYWSMEEQLISIPVRDTNVVLPEPLVEILARIAQLLNTRQAATMRIVIEIPFGLPETSTGTAATWPWPDSAAALREGDLLLQALRRSRSRASANLPDWLLEELRVSARPWTDYAMLPALDYWPATGMIHIRFLAETVTTP
jgi:type II secretory pathway predicted ATPase ExeA